MSVLCNDKHKKTRRQHVIPCSYLKGFSNQYNGMANKIIPNGEYKIYYYDWDTGKEVGPVKVASICFEIDIYEVTGKNDEVVCSNHLERFFGVLERQFGKRLGKIESILCEDVGGSQTVISEDDTAFWITFIVLQFLRLPQTLRAAEEFIRESIPELTEKQVKNNARLFCLPFFEELTEDKPESIIIRTLTEPLLNLTLQIGYDEKGGLITSDNPVIAMAADDEMKSVYLVIYPITTHICLIFSHADRELSGSVIRIDDAKRDYIFSRMAINAYRRMFFPRPLNEREIKMIEIAKGRRIQKR